MTDVIGAFRDNALQGLDNDVNLYIFELERVDRELVSVSSHYVSMVYLPERDGLEPNIVLVIA